MRNAKTRNAKTRNAKYNKVTNNIRHKRARTRTRASATGASATGGKAIDAGSYGCVFIPALKCNSNSVPYNPKNVTKLMFKEDATSEMEEIQKVKEFTKNIPNNDRYFIVSKTYECTPDKITKEEELSTLESKCKLFTERDINRLNINENLNKLSLITMPNGGLNIERYLLKMFEEPNKYNLFIKLNNALIELLKNGIIPINKMHYNHYDIKAGNILFSSDGNARLIDWGLSGSNDGKSIPDIIKNRSIAYNMPFSDIFFNGYIKQWLPEEFRKIRSSSKFRDKTEGQNELLKVIAVNLINKSIEETSEGHFEYVTAHVLHDIYKIYASKNKYNVMDFNVLTYNVLIDYIQAVLINYVDSNGIFNDIDYYYNVFVQNVDIWGFIMSYTPIFEEGVGKIHKDIINGVCRILLKYCFSPEYAIKPIDVNELILDLSSLNNIAISIQSYRIPTHDKLLNIKSSNRH